MSFEIVEHEGIRYAEIIWSNTLVEQTKFFSLPESSFQFGLLANTSGYIEEPHYHKQIDRTIRDLHQMFVVQRGKVAVDFFDGQKINFKSVVLDIGDAILLLDGVHSIRVLEKMQCISVKQGPFLGDVNDKINVGEKDD
jgi:hypothetical protein